MKRCIGMWKKENGVSPEVAELVIDGNHIEFYRRGHGEVFPCAFIGSDGEHYYKVFCNGRSSVGLNRTLEQSSSYRAFYVLQQNYDFPNGLDIKGIKEFSFIIPEIIDWLGIRTVDVGETENHELIAAECKYPPLVLHELNPHIEIRFESESYTKYLNVDTRTTFVLKNQPRLFVTYEEPTDIEHIQNDLEYIMQFWGLMIGHVSNIEDIRLKFDGQDVRSWLYINRDLSYNLRTQGIVDKPRTTLKRIDTKVTEYFTNWYSFCSDEKFEFVRRMYFAGNNRKDIFAEDILVQYVKILEGYHLRISGDEQTSEELRSALKTVEKDIKMLIFSEEGKPLFTAALEQAVPDWKFNSYHATNISQWIATGYLGKVGLAERIKELDNSFGGVIAKNAVDIIKLSRDNPPSADEANEIIIDRFYREIVATRNYFSHYKADRKNVLEYLQMNDTINVLKALIIMIFYSHMGMDKEVVRKVIEWDSELHFQSMCLRLEGERPDDLLFENDNVESAPVAENIENPDTKCKTKIGRLVKRVLRRWKDG